MYFKRKSFKIFFDITIGLCIIALLTQIAYLVEVISDTSPQLDHSNMIAETVLKISIPVSLLLILLLILLKSTLTPARLRHFRYQKYAKKAYKEIQRIPADPLRFGYLKHMNPYVFEELIIVALKKKGWKAKRSGGYSGDGGIDGKAKHGKDKYLIQAKCYTGYINRKHVQDFDSLCRETNRKGLFIHTGKTGKASWEAVEDSNAYGINNVEIISGRRLMNLIDAECDAF